MVILWGVIWGNIPIVIRFTFIFPAESLVSLGAAGHCLGFISILGGCDEPCPGVVKLPVQRTFWSLEFMNFSRSFFKKSF